MANVHLKIFIAMFYLHFYCIVILGFNAVSNACLDQRKYRNQNVKKQNRTAVTFLCFNGMVNKSKSVHFNCLYCLHKKYFQPLPYNSTPWIYGNRRSWAYFKCEIERYWTPKARVAKEYSLKELRSLSEREWVCPPDEKSTTEGSTPICPNASPLS